jgi:hypothetical protein
MEPPERARRPTEPRRTGARAGGNRFNALEKEKQVECRNALTIRMRLYSSPLRPCLRGKHVGGAVEDRPWFDAAALARLLGRTISPEVRAISTGPRPLDPVGGHELLEPALRRVSAIAHILGIAHW